MNYLDDPQRQQILTGALSARTPEQLTIAAKHLNAWGAMHPDDKGIQWAYEQIGLVELALQGIDFTCNTPPELATVAS